MTESKKALDAAIASKMSALITSKDRDLKRQTSALAATNAAIEEVERGIAEIDKAQLDLLEAARAENKEAPPPARKR